MDHLPYPTNPAHDPLQVPFLVDPDTIVDCCADDPCQRFRVEATSYDCPSLRDLAQTVQQWLYFGLVSRYIGHSVCVQDFLSDGYLNSERLPELLRNQSLGIPVDKELKAVELELRQFTIDHLNPYSTDLDDDNHAAQKIVLAIRVLTDSLWRAYRNYGTYAEDIFMRHHERYDNCFAPAELHGTLLRNRMSWKYGWCRSMVSSILRDYTASAAYYLSAIRHSQPIYGAADHRNCTDDRCNLHYDERSYEQTHTHQCQEDGNAHCQEVQAPVDDVMQILQRGGIPLMKIESNSLVARKADYGSPYVAATHVWAGGLGNPRGNIMYLCQLHEVSRLTASSQEAVRRFKPPAGPEQIFPTIVETIFDPLRLWRGSPPVRFWIDTLAIPRYDDDSVPVSLSQEGANNILAKRSLAIDRMTQTYAAADSAIVLDPELRQIDFQWHQRLTDRDNDEADKVLLQIFSSILVSSWMTRCWTYQEGAMAKELLIKLQKSIFPMRLARSDVLSRNRKRLQRCEYSDIHDMLDEISAWFSRLPATQQSDETVGRKEISDGEDGGPEVFTRIWNDLASRSTTRTVDRLSILSLLIDLRPSDVRLEPPRARLKAIFKAQKRLPLALLFQPPLTAKEREEESNEFKKEEEAEKSRGRELRPYEEDTSYPLPKSLRSKPLPNQLGWMQAEGDFIFFDYGLLGAGIRRPSLFRLPFSQIEGFTTYRLYDHTAGPNGCVFNMHLDSVEMHEDRENANAHLYLLTSSELQVENAFETSHTTFYGVLLHLEDHVRRNFDANNHTRDSWVFRCFCHVTCDAFEVLDPSHVVDLTHHSDIEREDFVDDCEYRIHCNFSNVTAPSRHLIRGFVRPESTAFLIHSTIMPILLFYYLICFGFTCIPVFAHTPGTFPKGWLAMIGFLISIRLLYFTWNATREYGKASNEIRFNAWVNGIGGDDGSGPIIDAQSMHTGFNINLSLRDSLGLALLCSVFIIAGAAKYNDHGVRWMIVVGGYGLGELLLRWILELCLPSSSVWGAIDEGGMPELPALRAAYLSPSRLTRKLRGLVRRM